LNFSISANQVDSRSISDNQVQISEFQKITEVSEFQKIAEISAFQAEKPTNQKPSQNFSGIAFATQRVWWQSTQQYHQ